MFSDVGRVSDIGLLRPISTPDVVHHRRLGQLRRGLLGEETAGHTSEPLWPYGRREQITGRDALLPALGSGSQGRVRARPDHRETEFADAPDFADHLDGRSRGHLAFMAGTGSVRRSGRDQVPGQEGAVPDSRRRPHIGRFGLRHISRDDLENRVGPCPDGTTSGLSSPATRRGWPRRSSDVPTAPGCPGWGHDPTRA